MTEAVGCTVAICIIILVYIIGDVYLAFHRGLLVSKRKTVMYLILSNIGNAILLGSQIFYVWTWPDFPLIALFMYYFGFALTTIPMVIRAWRIICLYGTSIDMCWNCGHKKTPGRSKNIWFCEWEWTRCCRIRDDIGRGKTIIRDSSWLHIRLLAMLTPTFVIVPVIVLFAGPLVGGLCWTAADFVVVVLLFGVSIRLFVVRRHITLDDMEESHTLLLYCAFMAVYFTANGIVWLVLLRNDSSYLLTLVIIQICFGVVTFILSIVKTALSIGAKKEDQRIGGGSAAIPLSVFPIKSRHTTI